MGPTVKLKVILLSVALFLLFIVPLHYHNFFRPNTVNEWRELTWDDFEGSAKPFTGYAAGINTDIVLAQDSAGGYYAKAIQNSRYSWRKRSLSREGWVLKHEQYHFNITEAYARKLSYLIARDSTDDSFDLNTYLEEVRGEMLAAQIEYDRDTEHSIIKNLQILWEVKIDSMLNAYGPPLGLAADPFTHVMVEFPGKPELITGYKDKAPVRTYQLRKYDINFIMSAEQNIQSALKWDAEEELLKRMYRPRIRVEKSAIRDNGFDLVFTDTLRRTKWIESHYFSYPNVVSLRANYSVLYNDTTLLRRLSESFVGSYRSFLPTDFWLALARNFTPNLDGVFDREYENLENCWVTREPQYLGYLSMPVYTESDSMIIGYEFPTTPKSKMQEGYLLWGDEVYVSEIKDNAMLFYIKQRKGTMRQRESVSIGYTLASDSAEVCRQLYLHDLYLGL